MPSSFDPPEPRQHRCELCDERAEVGTLCVLHAIRAAVDDNEISEAYAIAEDHGFPSSSVRRAIRDRDEYAMRLEAKRPCCRRCNLPILTGDGGEWTKSLHGQCENDAVAETLAKLNEPANDVAYGYYRLRATEEHGEMYCPPCLRTLAIDPRSSGSDWTALDAATARGGHCDACGESLDALPSVASVAL